MCLNLNSSLFKEKKKYKIIIFAVKIKFYTYVYIEIDGEETMRIVLFMAGAVIIGHDQSIIHPQDTRRC